MSDAHMQAFFNLMGPFVDYLAERWRDEHEYENIAEYATAIEKKLPTGFTFLEMTKRPFGFKFSAPDNRVHWLHVTARQIVMT